MSGFTFKPAKRENVPLLLGVAGGTGSGKTMSALRLARGLADGKRFAFLDTEARRGLHYADQFEFDHASLAAPFRPAKYLEAIQAADAAGYPVIVVDSTSHVWDGPGGCLEWHDELMGGKESKKMSSWILPKTEHRKMVNALTQLNAHLVLAFRAAQKVEMVKVDGKWEIVPKQSLTGLDGWIPICERSLPFELTMSLLLTAERPGVPHPIKLEEQFRPFLPLDRPISEETGRDLARWAAGGATEEDTRAPALVTELLSLAEQLGQRQRTSEAISATRRKHVANPERYAAWLEAQLAKAQAAVERQRQSADEELFTAVSAEDPAE